jgi:hypothetical protein
MRYYLNKTLQLQKEEFWFNEELNGGFQPLILDILKYDYNFDIDLFNQESQLIKLKYSYNVIRDEERNEKLKDVPLDGPVGLLEFIVIFDSDNENIEELQKYFNMILTLIQLKKD